ncbi:MAG: methyltransferase domain-containing protein [Dehalococcoidales bacterium]|jgi:2-polyprenyl-3-methyl-5-hydroxy-6-metoxy-1,4-benzoquinol methylase
MLPPIVLFTYNRINTLQRVLDAIQAQTKLPEKMIVFSDGACLPTDNGVLEVRKILRNIDWVDTEIIERPKNIGCASNIIDGLSDVFKSNSQAVILEDDVLPAHHFYESMVLMLEHYYTDEHVFAVGGYPSVSKTIADYPCDVIMSPRFSCWGWGTWADRWKRIEYDLVQRKLPYSTPDEIPTHAGEDIPASILQIKSHPDFYWDIPIALHCLRNNWFHAITNYYLTNNIGLMSGHHGHSRPELIQFTQENNAIEDKNPRKFSKPEADPRVDSAIRAYLSAVNQAAIPSKDASRTDRQIAQLAVSKVKETIKRAYNFIKTPIKSNKPIPAIKPNPKDYSTIVGVGSVVPCQIEAYFLALNQYLGEKETALDVGFGLGYGLNILAIKASSVSGVDVDPKTLEYCRNTILGRNPRLDHLDIYDGYSLLFPDNHFDLVTCVDVLEHVEDYHHFLDELLRVARKGVFISTPNRRPEYTNPDGTPKNYWHLREWSFEELDEILKQHGKVDWNFLNGPFEGPFIHSKTIQKSTLTLSPFVVKQ